MQLSHDTRMKGYVYILASQRNGTIYTGVTRDLPGRLYEHQNQLTPGFTSRYSVKTLVWFEEYDLLVDAIQREKSIKKYPRKWKLNLIEEMNPEWATFRTICMDCELDTERYISRASPDWCRLMEVLTRPYSPSLPGLSR